MNTGKVIDVQCSEALMSILTRKTEACHIVSFHNPDPDMQIGFSMLQLMSMMIKVTTKVRDVSGGPRKVLPFLCNSVCLLNSSSRHGVAVHSKAPHL